MTLQAVHQLAHDYLASKPEYDDFIPTLTGTSQPISGSPALSAQNSRDAITPIKNIRAGVSADTKPLVEAVLDSHEEFDWWNAYTRNDPAGNGMADRTAGCLLSGEAAAFTSEAGCAGFFYLQPHVEYAAHAHEPREIYAILSGHARFWDADNFWRDAGAGDVIRMPSMIWHGMETREEPVLILWAWVGDNLGEKPIFRDNNGELPK